MAIALEQSVRTESVDTALDSGSLATGATAGNLLITVASARWGASGPVGTFTVPNGYTLAFQIAPMEAHTAALAYKVAAGGETAVTWTADGTFDGTAVALDEFSGITSPVLDKTADDGTNASSATSIATSSTGTLGASVGLAFLVGLARKSANDGVLSNDASMAEIRDLGVSGGSTSYNECHAWQEFAASTAYNVTVSADAPGSRMGAGIATFIADAGGADPEGSLIRGKLLRGGLLLGGVLVR